MVNFGRRPTDDVQKGLGWVFVGYVDEQGEEREASYRCRRCADKS